VKVSSVRRQSARIARLGRKARGASPGHSAGRMRAEPLPHLDATQILCLQPGTWNTGFRSAAAICPRPAPLELDSRRRCIRPLGRRSPEYRKAHKGFELADSWATDGTKWPNIGYDWRHRAGCVSRQAAAAMSIQAAYPGSRGRPRPIQLQSRAIPACARRGIVGGLRSLGRQGMARFSSAPQACAPFAAGLKAAGLRSAQDVVINRSWFLSAARKGPSAPCRLPGRRHMLVRGPQCGRGYSHAPPAYPAGPHNGDVERSLAAMLRRRR